MNKNQLIFGHFFLVNTSVGIGVTNFLAKLLLFFQKKYKKLLKNQSCNLKVNESFFFTFSFLVKTKQVLNNQNEYFKLEGFFNKKKLL